VGSFRLHLAAEGKAGRTLHTYTEAVRWFAAGHLLRETDKTRWEQVGLPDSRHGPLHPSCGSRRAPDPENDGGGPGRSLFAWAADLDAPGGGCALGRLVTCVCAMTSAVAARLVYQMQARMSLDNEGVPYGDHQSG
jgi:hypothetical protein